MILQALKNGDVLWAKVADYAEHCAWSAGKKLAEQMRAGSFDDWERVFVALEETRIIGYCTLAKTDCIPNLPYTPYIGFLFVDQGHRGNRLSQGLIGFAMAYAKELGFDQVYLISDHVNFYEKYGFVKIGEKPAPWNPTTMESIFMHRI